MIAQIIFSAAEGSVIAVAGASREQALVALDNADCGRDRRLALFIPLRPATSAEEIVEQVTDVLAETALRVWPIWFTDMDFGECRGDRLGREAARIRVRTVSDHTPSVLLPWAEAAADAALSGRKPRVRGAAPAMEIGQLCLAINQAGLILVVDMDAALTPAAALVHALEWTSRNAGVGVVALFSKVPENVPPFDRILPAVCVCGESDGVDRASPDEAIVADHPWLCPIRGIPHPLSETEQRLAKALLRDPELAALFRFNQLVETIRGSRPKVDLLWSAGRLVVELDGYADHGTRSAFMHDRRRDYELTLSGYTVIRLSNDEIAQDIESTVEKIRDVVQLCRARLT